MGTLANLKSHIKIEAEDLWHGFRRAVFDFEGHRAWIVFPSVTPVSGMPWTWTMQWADAFVERTGVPDMLSMGWHHATIETFGHRMDDEGLRVCRSFQRFLAECVGFATKAHLIGMSWGGFFSVRYTAAYPDCVAKMYLDAPLLNFDGFPEAEIGPWKSSPAIDGDWSNDPRMPLNLAGKLIEARIPVLLLYGGQDQTVPPEKNSLPFIERYRQAGELGKLLTVVPRAAYGHHPHGVEIDATQLITDFLKMTDC